MALIADEPEVRSYLERMGLTLAGLERVVSRGGGGWASTTKFHTSSAPGTFLYHETTAALRGLCVPLDWEMDEEDNQPRVFRRASRTASVVQTGDEYTGIDGAKQPTTRHPKGQATQRKVDRNETELALFPIPSPMREVDDREMLTWVLLIAAVGDKIRAELSLPSEMSGGKPKAWLERIVLPEQDLGGGLLEIQQPPAEPTDDVQVAWR